MSEEEEKLSEFTEYLTYKAALAGIKVIKIFENWKSQRGTRTTPGLFICKTCGEENANRNASFNIAYRALSSPVSLCRYCLIGACGAIFKPYIKIFV